MIRQIVIVAALNRLAKPDRAWYPVGLIVARLEGLFASIRAARRPVVEAFRAT
jgi:hypothetical protein